MEAGIFEQRQYHPSPFSALVNAISELATQVWRQLYVYAAALKEIFPGRMLKS
jgi:hypothetical protein